MAAFTPSSAEIQAAKHLLQASQEARKEGRGAFALDGKMVDMPMISDGYLIWTLSEGGEALETAMPAFKAI